VINTADFSLKPGSLSSSERSEAVKQLEKLGKLNLHNHRQMRQFSVCQRVMVLLSKARTVLRGIKDETKLEGRAMLRLS